MWDGSGKSLVKTDFCRSSTLNCKKAWSNISDEDGQQTALISISVVVKASIDKQ